jgi:hypothetical protein
MPGEFNRITAILLVVRADPLMVLLLLLLLLQAVERSATFMPGGVNGINAILVV